MCKHCCKDCENRRKCMSMMNMLMCGKEDVGINYMYRNSYTRILYPMLKHHCNMKRFNFSWKSYRINSLQYRN